MEVSAGLVHYGVVIPPVCGGQDDILAEIQDDAPADEAATRAHLLQRARGLSSVPIPSRLVQDPDPKANPRAGLLATFVKNGDLRGLRAYLFILAVTSSGESEWSTALRLGVWARVFDATVSADPRSAATSTSKILRRLSDRKLILRERAGRDRKVKVTLLNPDGSGAPYEAVDGREEKYFRLHQRFWTDRLYADLDLPATAMLLVALHAKPVFELPAEWVPQWYGWSADTAERGLKRLEDLGLIAKKQRVKAAPLSPTGATIVNVYALTGPFARKAKQQVITP